MDEKESIKKLAILKHAIESCKGENPINVENSYYATYGCNDEKDKIVLETKFLINKLRKQENQDNEDFIVDMNLLRVILTILDRNKSINISTYKLLKQNIINIEIKYGIRIRLYSEVENMYQQESSELKRPR